MDDRRFDDLTRLIGSSRSRRALLRGILGFAGAGFAASTTEADARTLQTRGPLTTAPPPSCMLPKQMCGGECCEPGKCKDGHCCPNTTDVWCGDRCWPEALCTSNDTQCEPGQKVCGTICCDETAACTRSDNTDTCCDPTTNYPCGLECCPSELQCCDGECCAGTDICLTQVFPEGPFVEEEVCCPAEQTCDQRCCEGTCFTPLGSTAAGVDRTCCPPDARFCPGTGEFANLGLCCEGETPDCCHNPDGSPVCLTEEQCCTHEECDDFTDPSECLEGICDQFTCVAESICGSDVRCCIGGDNVCCPEDQDCCGPICCDEGLRCCEAMVDGVLQQTCIDPETQCCTHEHCVGFGYAADCVTCNLATHACDAANEDQLCNASECATCQDRQCVDTDNECEPPDECSPAVCIDGACQPSVCAEPAPDCCGTSIEGCVNLNSDESNCGVCGNACDPGFICMMGRCVCDDHEDCPSVDACTPGECIQGACRTESSCTSDETCCGESCVDTSSDADHCGGCWVDCTAGECQDGRCVCTEDEHCEAVDSCTPAACEEDGLCRVESECSMDETCCGESCVDTSSNAEHCGGCGEACLPGFICLNGQCFCDQDEDCPEIDACTPGECLEGVCRTDSFCPAGAACCVFGELAGCVDITSDESNCGGCNITCTSGMCQNGACVCSEAEDCPVVDACTPPECDGGICRTSSICPQGQICCGTGAEAACCTAAECINGACCTGQNEEICGEVCCTTQCCQNLSGSACVGDDERCCNTEADCVDLNRCILPNDVQLLHERWFCSSRGVCEIKETVLCEDNDPCTLNACIAATGCRFDPMDCSDPNPCTDDVCDLNVGCVHLPKPINTKVAEGVCCAGGVLKPSGSICCSDFSDCPVKSCMSRSCTGGVCVYESTCFPFNDCQTASCTSGTCVRTTDCGGRPTGLDNGESCSFGCQCSSSWCANQSGQGRCTNGGSGSAFPFCPSP